MKYILITGGAGFIGSNFIPYFIKKYSEYHIINLDKLTYAGDIKNLKEVEKHERYSFVHGDICNRKLVESLLYKFNIFGIIHFAAESHVDNSIENPDDFIKTNIYGTYILIDAAYKYWMDQPFKYKKQYKNNQLPRFHHISTDEVYGSLGSSGLFSESTPYAPNSPYSASKAAGDMILRSYHNTYGLNVVITNCSNNYGPKQNKEKLIPTIIRKALSNERIPIYGDGKNIRDWIYVLDHCQGVDLVYHKGKPCQTYNIGGNNERDNNYIVISICDILDKIKPKKNKSYKEQISYVKDRPGHDRRYAIDASKIKTELGWKPEENFKKGLLKTVKWYLENYFGK